MFGYQQADSSREGRSTSDSLERPARIQDGDEWCEGCDQGTNAEADESTDE